MKNFWIIWAAVIMTAMLYLYMPSASAEMSVVYEENFESMVPGAEPEGMTAAPGENCEISVKQVNGNHYVYLLSRKNQEAKLTKDLDQPVSGLVSLEQKVLVAANFNDGHKFFSLKNEAGKYVGMVMESGGDLVLRTGGAPYQVLVPDYKLNTWYDIKITANTNTQQICAFVDSKLICKDIAFWNQADTIAAIEAYAQGNNRGMCIDDVRVTADDPESYLPEVSAVSVTGREKFLVSTRETEGRYVQFRAETTDQYGQPMEGQSVQWSLDSESLRKGFAIDENGKVSLPKVLDQDCIITATAAAGRAQNSAKTQILCTSKVAVSEDFTSCGADGMGSDYVLTKPENGRAEIAWDSLILKGGDGAASFKVTFPETLRNMVVISCDVRFSSITPYHNVVNAHDGDIIITTHTDGSISWRGANNVYTPIFSNYEANKTYNIRLEIPYPSGDVTAYVTPSGGETVTTSGLARRNGNSGMSNFETYTYEKSQFYLYNLQIYEQGAETACALKIQGADTAYIPETAEALYYDYLAKNSNPIFDLETDAENVTWSAEGANGVEIDAATGRLTVPSGIEDETAVTIAAEANGLRDEKTVLLKKNAAAYTTLDVFRYANGNAAARIGMQSPQSEEKWMRLLLALYDENGMLVYTAVSARDEEDKNNELQYVRAEGALLEVQIPAEYIGNAVTARAFLWNTKDGLIPLTEPSPILSLAEVTE